MLKKGKGSNLQYVLNSSSLSNDCTASNIVFVCRSDHKEVPDHSADSQSGYSQREFHIFLNNHSNVHNKKAKFLYWRSVHQSIWRESSLLLYKKDSVQVKLLRILQKKITHCFMYSVKCCLTEFCLFISTVGGWFLPGQSPIYPSSSPPQFSSSTGHSSGSYCERYSSLRSHRAAPYPSHYPHRSSSTSKSPAHLLNAAV